MYKSSGIQGSNRSSRHKAQRKLQASSCTLKRSWLLSLSYPVAPTDIHPPTYVNGLDYLKAPQLASQAGSSQLLKQVHLEVRVQCQLLQTNMRRRNRRTHMKEMCICVDPPLCCTERSVLRVARRLGSSCLVYELVVGLASAAQHSTATAAAFMVCSSTNQTVITNDVLSYFDGRLFPIDEKMLPNPDCQPLLIAPLSPSSAWPPEAWCMPRHTHMVVQAVLATPRLSIQTARCPLLHHRHTTVSNKQGVTSVTTHNGPSPHSFP